MPGSGLLPKEASANILVFGRYTWSSYASPMRWQENHQRRKERSDDIHVLFRSRDKFVESTPPTGYVRKTMIAIEHSG